MREQRIIQEKIRHLELDPPLILESGTTLETALAAMRREKQNCALICEKDRCIGIFTERDCLNKVLGKSFPSGTPVNALMSPDPKTLTLDDTVERAIRMMNELGIRNVPLVNSAGQCAGLLRVRNIIRYLAELFPEEVLNVAPRPDQKFSEPDGA